ncbi:MAG: CotH kinase family protein [Chloroflexota bacterium]|nr:CotH kinase family protein [Chloroflexota bacterium]
MMTKTHTFTFALLMLLAMGFVPAATAQEAVPDWPDHYDPFTLLTYQLEMTEADWDTIRYDLTFDIEVPALFWAEDETPIPINVRRKSADSFPLNDPANPEKVSLKLDLNDFTGEAWHGLNKLSLENGDDNNVVTEGMSWYLHRLAQDDANFDYTSGLASWITLYITLTGRVDGDGNPLPDLTFYNGVFVNVEHRDKQWLKNHLLWQGGDNTWLYKYSDPYEPAIKVGPEDELGNPVDSPAYDTLFFKPFQRCTQPCALQPATETEFANTLTASINMEGMLTFAAVSAFHVSPDDLFSKGKNFFFVDYTQPPAHSPDLAPLREYVEWDLDAAYAGMDYEADIYNVGDGSGQYENWIIDNEIFNEQYTQIMQDLIADDGLPEATGPLNEAAINGALTAFEALLGDALDADPYNMLGDPVPEYFEDFRTWHSNRIANVQTQLPLAVLLASFSASAQANHVLVSWATVSEVDNAGFNVYRGLSAGAPETLLGFVPSAVPGSAQGAGYSYADLDIADGQTYWYWLEDVDTSGATGLHGPVSVTYLAPTAVTLSDLTAGGQPPENLNWLLPVALALAAAGAAFAWHRRVAAN